MDKLHQFSFGSLNSSGFEKNATVVLIALVGTRFLRGPILLLGSHTKDPSQYDLQRVDLKSLGLVTGQCSGSDFREILVEKGVGFEYLNPMASHPMGLGSSDLIRGPLRSSLVTRRWVFFMICLCYQGASTHRALFSGGGLPTPYQIHLLLLLYQPVFAVLRPHVGSTFTRLTFVPSVQSQNCWGWLIKLKNTALSGAEH